MVVDESFLRVESLNLALGRFALNDVTLACDGGEYHILLGPTGSGKSTLLKCILGFHEPSSGCIYLGGKEITQELPERRQMGYVPQDYALFPHLNVEDNLRFGTRARGMSAKQADLLLGRLCEILAIEKLRKRRVQHLSGGERQKVAIGRALATQPEMILLDEPFSSIDERARRGLWFELKQIVREVGITTLHVTHNLEEAYTLGERVSIMIDGNLVQSGNKQEVFERPANENVARYFNYSNLFEGVAGKHPEGTRIDLGHFSVLVSREIADGNRVKVCVRQQDIRIVKEGLPLKDSLRRNLFSGEIVDLFPLQETFLMWFRIDGSASKYDLELRFPIYVGGRHQLHRGKKIRVALWEPMIIVFE
jgi:ABC-type Fe3+/spermidine/putrescine transport system ATPase subunit